MKPSDSVGNEFDQPSFPNNADILVGSTPVEDAVRQMASVRMTLSTFELGVLAGRGALDQYYASKSALTMRWQMDCKSLLSLQYLIPEIVMPLAGFAAALGVDYEIFGGAAHNMIRTNLPINAFSIGSLIFAGALGLSQHYRKTLFALMIAASAGAAFLAADNQQFRDGFTHTIASAFTTDSDAPTAAVEALQKQIDYWKESRETTQHELDTGGNPDSNGKPQGILSDHVKGNDDYGNRLQARIDNLTAQIDAAIPRLSAAQSNLELASRKDWAQFTGRGLATAYIFCWLAASQILISHILRSASTILRSQRKRSADINTRRLLVLGFENPDRARAKALISAAVGNMLTRFAEISAIGAGTNAAKQAAFAQLFDVAGFQQMQAIGTTHAFDAVEPRLNLWRKAARLISEASSASGAPRMDAPSNSGSGPQSRRPGEASSTT